MVAQMLDASNEQIFDFRSDTLTSPSDAMRKRMASAEVGDDFYREDPSIRALEDLTATILGKEDALFVLSGTMGNLVSIRSQVPSGRSAIVSATSHLHVNETGHLASICGITSQTFSTPGGKFDLGELMNFAKIPSPNAPRSVLAPPLKLICVENTHNGEGGRCLNEPYLNQLRRFADERDLIFHMDGARLFNAAVALSVDPSDLVAPVDSVSFCLSKGLGAPGGAMIAGSRDFIEEARHWRQMVGGGMRQSGIMAAAGHFALKENLKRLHEDHSNAKALALGLDALGFELAVETVETNIVMAFLPKELGEPASLHKRLYQSGVRVLPPKGNRLRFVTHMGLNSDDIEAALKVIGRLVEGRN